MRALAPSVASEGTLMTLGLGDSTLLHLQKAKKKGGGDGKERGA